MRRFKFIPHTADVRMKISGETPEELFRAGILGLAEFLKPGFCSGASGNSEKISVSISSPDITALLVDFLSEVLTASHTKQAIFCSVDFNELTETKVEATVVGAKVKEFDDDIKAVTYHEADVRKNEKDEWETIIVFDI